MHFQLTEDQSQLQRALREVVTDRQATWQELAELGLFTLRVPETDGGLGLGLPEAALAFEEAGRAVLGGPLVGTELAGAVLALPGRAELVRVPARGPVLVADLPALDHVLLLHPDDSLAVVPAAEATASPAVGTSPATTALAAVDPDRPLWRLDGPLPLGEHSPVSRRVAAEGTLLTAALQVGLAARTVAEAAEYARTREQFGQPIGAFQAVQHLCADMLARAELARVAVYAAAVSGDEAEIAGAKLLADDAAVHGARDCLQVHGGMGFTWEARVHRLLKRAWAQEQAVADRERCLDVLAAHL